MLGAAGRRKAALAGGALAVVVACVGFWRAGWTGRGIVALARGRVSSQEEVTRSKMQDVVRRAIALTKDASARVALESGEIFLRINGLEMEVVGVSVPIDASRNRVWLSFAGDYFRSRSVEVLAHDLLEDLSRTSPATAAAK